MITTQTLDAGIMVYETLSELLPTFPIIATEGVEGPFAVYRRTGITGRDTKDRYDYEETVTMEVIITDTDYDRGLDTAKKAKKALEARRGKWRDLVICRVKMIAADEDWHSNAFIQRLLFTVTIDNS